MQYFEDLSRRQPARSGTVAALVAATFLLLVAAGPAGAATTFTVNSVSDAGDANLADSFCDANPLPQVELCTLRAAIQEANDTPGADVIDFDILGTGVKTIKPASELPAITGPVTVDGYTQPGASPNTAAKGTNAKLLVELDGSGAGGSADGLVINASNVLVRGLVINSFGTSNFRIFSPSGPTDNNTIEGNFIGTDPSGTLGPGIGFGVDVLDGENNTVGGTSPAARNLISGNGADGVFIGVEASGTRVQGNLIGTERDGKSPLGNADEGVDIFNAEGAILGGATPGAANTIAFNEEDGVLVSGRSASGNRILRSAIFSNGELGIDVSEEDDGGDGPTANDPADADVGANGLQNKPVITSARASDRVTAIKGKLNSTPRGTFTIQLFSNPIGDAEGKKFLGQKVVTTGANGDVSFSFKTRVRRGTVTATATSSGGDTSEFSAPRRVRRA